MNYFPYIILLVSLSGLSLLILVILSLLNFIHVTSKQKIIVIKVGLVIIGIAPFIFNLIKLFSISIFNIPLTAVLDNQFTNNSVYINSIKPQIDWLFFVFLAYCIGFLAMICRIIYSYLYTKKLLSKSIPMVIHGQTIFTNKYIQSPLSFGFPYAQIYFPSNAEAKLTKREMQISLAHEKIHLEHNDSLWKLLSLLIQALLFFVPWSYILHKKFDLEMEILCDEKSCVRTHASSNEYGKLLLAMVCQQPENLIITHLSNSDLKRRFIAMKSKAKPRPIFTLISTAILLLVGTTAIATASGVSLKRAAFNVSSQIYVDGELVSSPHIIAKENQLATMYISDQMSTTHGKIHMSGKSLKIDLLASNISNSNGKIKLIYEVFYKNGSENMHFKPQFIVLPKQNAAMRWKSDSGHAYELHVVVERA